MLNANHLFTKRQKICRASLVLLLIFAISGMHYADISEESILHIIYRELYFLPIIMAGLWFGLRGGIAASLVITILYLPTVLASPSWNLSVHKYGNLLEILLFNVVGITVGWLRNREFMLSRQKCEADHLASLGQAVSCIAHDMKTPLTAIGGFIRQARKKITEPKKADTRLGYAQDQVERMETMVLDMLAFARPLELQCREESLVALLDDTIRTVAEKAAIEKVNLHVDISRDETVICCDRHRLQQGVMNLLNNAIEATPERGRVTVRGKKKSDTILIEVIDQGEGIPAEERDNILKPFVTTKRSGTGLGLPIVNKVTTAHGGKLEIDDNPEGGTIFRLILPV